MITKIRDLPPFGLRIEPALRHQLQREAEINNRSLSAEILSRLRDSLARQQQGYRELHAAQPTPDAPPMSDAERAMLATFRRMPVEKQLALLSFCK